MGGALMLAPKRKQIVALSIGYPKERSDPDDDQPKHDCDAESCKSGPNAIGSVCLVSGHDQRRCEGRKKAEETVAQRESPQPWRQVPTRCSPRSGIPRVGHLSILLDAQIGRPSPERSHFPRTFLS
jgi:hypothetical protein